MEPARAPQDIPRVRGQLVLARLDHLRSVFGPVALPRVLALLPRADAESLRDAARDRWYPFSLLHHLDEAIAHELAAGDPTIFERLGEASARHRTEWLGEHAALVSVHGFLSRVAEEHHRFHSFGKAVYRRRGFHQGELQFSEYPEAYATFCSASRGYFMGVLQMLTGNPGTVEEAQCQCRKDPACVFTLRWQRDLSPPPSA
jgi:hypothetical protein